MVQDSAASYLKIRIFYPQPELDPTKVGLPFGFYPSLRRAVVQARFCCPPTTPTPCDVGLGCSRFARRYYGNRVCFLFLQLLRCFSSLGCLLPNYELYR